MFTDFLWPWTGGGRVQPSLEVLRRRPSQSRFDTPLVFVHGAYVGAWCWDRYFLPYFADRGFEVHAPSLRGHGASGGSLRDSGVRDYIADLESVVAGLTRPPVLVGHSMGGVVVQRFLERHPAAGAVLMASVPPSGLLQSTLRLMLGDPMLFTQMTLMQGVGPGAVDIAIARRAIFSERVPEADLMRYAELVQPESHRALLELTAGGLPRPGQVECANMLVLGAAEDALFSEDEVRQTAAAYDAPCHIEPEMAHAMMLEPNWRSVADRIADWLVARGID